VCGRTGREKKSESAVSERKRKSAVRERKRKSAVRERPVVPEQQPLSK
jgi:hypothetical protein